MDSAIELSVATAWGSRPLIATTTNIIELAPRDSQSSCFTRLLLVVTLNTLNTILQLLYYKYYTMILLILYDHTVVVLTTVVVGCVPLGV